MAKALHCNEIFSGCDFVARGTDDDEVLALAMQHAQSKHILEKIDWDVLAKFCGAIRKVEGQKVSSA